METADFEDSLLMLTHASLLKRRIDESEPASPSSIGEYGSSPDDRDETPSRQKRSRVRKAKASVTVDQTDINVSVSFSPRAERAARRVIQDTSSGSEENSDDFPMPSIAPAALVAKLDPNLPLDATLDRTMLLAMSSKDFEAFFAQLSTERTLSRSEEKMLKAQRRLISNRESAQASRRRKKAYIEELEGRVLEMSYKMAQVAANNAALSAQTAELINENASLKTKLDEMDKNQAQVGPASGPPP